MRFSPTHAHSPSFSAQTAPMHPQSPTSPGYTPTSYDVPAGQHGAYVRPEDFYGSLIDMNTGRPTEMLCRLSDALFTYLDMNVEITQFRRTGFIEPLKYGWLFRRIGTDAIVCQTLEENMQEYYNIASVPYQIVPINGIPTPILDRRGFLHMIVFDVRSDPNGTHQEWQKSMAAITLVDPATNAPFPTPLPRSAMPFVADPQLALSQQSWVLHFTAQVARAQTNAQLAQIMGTRGSSFGFGAPTANPYAVANPFMATNPYLAQYQAQAQAQTQVAQAQNRTSTMVSVAKVVGGLATTLLGGGIGGTGFPSTGFN